GDLSPLRTLGGSPQGGPVPLAHLGGSPHGGPVPLAHLQHEIDRRAFAHRPFGPDPAAVPVDDALRHREPDTLARKLALAVEALEGAEELVRVDHVEADAVVANEEPCLNRDALGAD